MILFGNEGKRQLNKGNDSNQFSLHGYILLCSFAYVIFITSRQEE